MSGLVLLSGALVLGAGLQARLGRGRGLPWPVGVVLWALLGLAFWLEVTGLVGLRWTVALILLPVAASAALLVPSLARRAWPRVDGWAALAFAAAAAQAVRLSTTPAFGWDFRYIWGLKARVFAGAAGFDWAWLAWPGHSFAHPDYPPLWTAIVASTVLFGADPGAAASWWQGVLAPGLGAACWWAASGAARPTRALAAVAGAACPVVFAARHIGYADAAIAFGAVVALAALDKIGRGEIRSTIPVTAGVAFLALAKNEGLALAVGVVLGAVMAVGLRRGAIAAIGLGPALLWRAAAGLHGIGGEDLAFSFGAVLARAVALPAAVGALLSSPEVLALAIAWVLALAGSWANALRPVRLALLLWALAVLASYVVGVHDLRWWVGSSFDRVLAAPLPAVIAIGLRQRKRVQPVAVDRREAAQVG